MGLFLDQQAFIGERAQDLLDERIEMGGFRCDNCGLVKPLPWTEQDGFKLCRRCRSDVTPIEAQRIIADSISRAGDQPVTPLPISPTGLFTGASAVTGIAPTTLSLSRSVPVAGSIVLTGVNFSASDAITTTNGTITITTTVNSSTQITLSILNTGSTPAGDYNLLFNSSVLTPRGILKVR